MKKVFVFHWSALQDDSLTAIHECYLAAFAAVGSDKLTTWEIGDTAKRIGIPPEVTWSSEDSPRVKKGSSPMVNKKQRLVDFLA